jgi:predicted metalloprotease with PDZ domain
MRTLALLLLLSGTPVAAQLSAPQPVAHVDTIPAPRDIDYPGTMTVRVDATDIEQGIMRVRQSIPVSGGQRVTLLLPAYLPGKHASRLELDKMAGLVIRAGGRVLRWDRDPVDVHAFHVTIPPGARALDLEFQHLSAVATDQGRITVTREMMNLQFEQLAFYPAGYFTRRVPVTASVTYPKGWQAATALRPTGTNADTNTVAYGTVSYEALQDSPIFAGKYFRQDDLGSNVFLNTVADDPKELVVPPAVLQAHRNLVDQSLKLFGTRPFDRYDFLHAITNRMGGIGLEHHRSSENQNDPGYFIDWAASLPDHNLLPHEFVHSWNGKHRLGADSWTPDFRTPKRNSLLWVYEGQTQFWGHVLEARSGMTSKQDKLDTLAAIAAALDNRPARSWRSLDDTVHDPIITPRRPKAWVSWQRSEDYYNEGLLIWTEVDAIIRQGTNNARSMDDFARGFFGGREGDYGQRTYTFEDIVAGLNAVHPYGWGDFLTSRLTQKDRAPFGGFERSGYRLTYGETPTNWIVRLQKAQNYVDLIYSLGLNVAKGKISAVQWDGPAFKAGLTVGQEIIGVNGAPYGDEAIRAAVTAAKGGRAPIRLTVKTDDRVRDVAVQWNGGLRYPRFEKVAGAPEGPLDRLLAPR